MEKITRGGSIPGAGLYYLLVKSWVIGLRVTGTCTISQVAWWRMKNIGKVRNGSMTCTSRHRPHIKHWSYQLATLVGWFGRIFELLKFLFTEFAVLALIQIAEYLGQRG